MYLIGGQRSLRSSLIRKSDEDDGNDQKSLENHFDDRFCVATLSRRDQVLSKSDADNVNKCDFKVNAAERERERERDRLTLF
jgi:hypothetical protein